MAVMKMKEKLMNIYSNYLVTGKVMTFKKYIYMQPYLFFLVLKILPTFVNMQVKKIRLSTSVFIFVIFK